MRAYTLRLAGERQRCKHWMVPSSLRHALSAQASHTRPLCNVTVAAVCVTPYSLCLDPKLTLKNRSAIRSFNKIRIFASSLPRVPRRSAAAFRLFLSRALLPAFTELIVGAFRAVNREGVHDLIVVVTISVTVDVSSPQT